jgi:hypothetical protein
MNIIKSLRARRLGMLVAFVVAFGLLPFYASASGWLPVPVATNAPEGIETMLLLSDGTVMAQGGGGTNWYRLTPGSTGGYTNGSWTTLHAMEYTRLYYSSQVLPNGHVFVAGGEYGSGGTNGEVYDPVANNWTECPNTPGVNKFADSISETLPNGNVLISPVGPSSEIGYGGTLIWNTYSSTWSVGPTLYEYDSQSESSWVKLPDASILTVNALDNNGGPGTNSQRYIPSLNQWIPDQDLPVQLWADLCGMACFVGEAGPAFLLPNGNAFFLGGTGATAIYKPSGSTNEGAWITGPTIINGLTSADAPAAMMVNGQILCALSAEPYLQDGTNVIFPTPTSFCIYDYSSGSLGTFTQINAPGGGTTASGVAYNDRMLDLPDGTVLFTTGGTQLYVYVPGGSPLASGQPTINTIAWNADGSLLLSGTLFNGISEGAAYGDDAQMNSNYPLVRFIDGNGNVIYGRTYNWSSTGVQTGNQIVTTDCTVPASVYDSQGTYSVQVIANGIASAAVTFHSPVWVDFNYTGTQLGTYQEPYSTLAQGVSAVVSGGTIAINSGVQPSTSSQTMTISKPITIISVNGPATVGN